jgi:cytochrome b561
MVALGWYMLSIEDQPGSRRWFDLHISLGLTAAVLIALRLAWRLGHAPAVLEPADAGWQHLAARTSHALIYCTLVALPLTGYLGAAFSGRKVAAWGIAFLAWASKNERVAELLFGLHSVTAWTLVALVALHVLAALKHLLVDRDGVFERMWP